MEKPNKAPPIPDKEISKSYSCTLPLPILLRYFERKTTKIEPIVKILKTRYRKLKVSPNVSLMKGILIDQGIFINPVATQSNKGRTCQDYNSRNGISRFPKHSPKENHHQSRYVEELESSLNLFRETPFTVKYPNILKYIGVFLVV